MGNVPIFAFCAVITATSSQGRIDRVDGQSVEISGHDLGDLLRDLSAAMDEGFHKYRQQVLAEWFARGGKAQRLRLVG
jgi:hypothetical protein